MHINRLYGIKKCHLLCTDKDYSEEKLKKKKKLWSQKYLLLSVSPMSFIEWKNYVIDSFLYLLLQRYIEIMLNLIVYLLADLLHCASPEKKCLKKLTKYTYSSTSQHLLCHVNIAAAAWTTLSFWCFSNNTWLQASAISYTCVAILSIFVLFRICFYT